MSNPGVVLLSETKIGNSGFRIEDNIGESIHIHCGNIRMDFTINEFIKFADTLIDIAERMIGVREFRFCNYDAIFLSQVDNYLLNLERIEFVERNVAELTTDVEVDGKLALVNIKDSRVSLAIDGKTDILEKRKQTNYFGENNLERMKGIYKSIRDKGYNPECRGSYIVVCDNGNYIIDGCHRASSVYKIKGNVPVLVSNWITRNNICTYEKDICIIETEKMKQERCKKNMCMVVEYLIERDLKHKKILFKGAGRHTVELLKYMCNDSFDIVGIIADEIKDESLLDYRRVDNSEIETLDADVIIISSYRYRLEMKRDLQPYASRFIIYDFYEKGVNYEFF